MARRLLPKHAPESDLSRTSSLTPVPEAKLPRLSSASCELLLGIPSVLELPRFATYHLF